MFKPSYKDPKYIQNLKDSIVAWKDMIKVIDNENSFRVCMLYKHIETAELEIKKSEE